MLPEHFTFSYLYGITKLVNLQEAHQNTDQELMSDFTNGRKGAFDRIYAEFSERLFHFARRFVDLEAEAEDITAEAFVKLWLKRADFPSIDAIAVFLHTTVRNKCLDYLRHEKLKLRKNEDLIRTLEALHQADFSRELQMMALMSKIYQEVDRLPYKMKNIFYLSYKEGLKPAQIAEKLDLSVQTVKNQRVNAIKLLQIALKDHPLLLCLLIQLTCK